MKRGLNTSSFDQEHKLRGEDNLKQRFPSQGVDAACWGIHGKLSKFEKIEIAVLRSRDKQLSTRPDKATLMLIHPEKSHHDRATGMTGIH